MELGFVGQHVTPMFFNVLREYVCEVCNWAVMIMTFNKSVSCG